MKITDINGRNKFSFSCIYKWTNLINNKIYIGQTVNFYNRMHTYKCGVFNGHMKNAIKKYGIDNFDITILEKDVSKENLTEREQYWIDFYESYNVDKGYNLCPIANSSVNCRKPPHTLEWKKQHSKQVSGENNPMYGFHRYGSSNPNAKSVQQYSLDGTFIKEYGSAIEASVELNIDKTSIRTCCRGKNKTAGGYQWKYTNDNKQITPIIKSDKVVPKENIIGNKYYYLTVLEQIEDYITPKGKHCAQYLCKCDCGKIIKAQKGHLTSGHVKSCGCHRKQKG